ncbi:PilZ domain protein [Paenibacillus konkukensis]|uniref:PilZ domain protein n=1 Tax=Paenibacillus konkukensis TaxID=2020716 RepID=A0ABY4RPQ8_9BACL|nr:PilZ domain-containing protein [Paenibacillus konkukensis]UQZ84466.1 PilZ domain protein [Paenibacillus konkukensis]
MSLKPAAAKAGYDYTGEKYKSPAGILLHSRTAVDENGLIHAVIGTGRQQRRELDPKLAIHLMNISVSGIGFTVREELGLGNAGQIEVELELGFDLIGKAEIVRQEMLGERHYYGAQFIDLSGDKSTSLRAYILRKQVEAYFSRKHENAEKRLFK